MPFVHSNPTLEIDAPPAHLSSFASLLQHGVLFHLERPVALLAFLLTLPGFSADYIEKNVQTIFINGVAADNLNQEMADNCTVALSAAMPGLAGAIFRRQGVHGSLRSKQLTDAVQPMSGSGILTLKCFNSIATDRVEDLLRQGVLVAGQAFVRFAQMRSHLFAPPLGLTWEGKEAGYGSVLEKAENTELIRIRLKG